MDSSFHPVAIATAEARDRLRNALSTSTRSTNEDVGRKFKHALLWAFWKFRLSHWKNDLSGADVDKLPSVHRRARRLEVLLYQTEWQILSDSFEISSPERKKNT